MESMGEATAGGQLYPEGRFPIGNTDSPLGTQLPPAPS